MIKQRKFVENKKVIRKNLIVTVWKDKKNTNKIQNRQIVQKVLAREDQFSKIKKPTRFLKDGVRMIHNKFHIFFDNDKIQ